MNTEKDKMLSGVEYIASDPLLVKERMRAHELCREFNRTLNIENFSQFFGDCGSNLYIEAPFFCDYLYNINIGNNVYMNFNCTILDCAEVRIGDNVKFGPGVQIYTAGHSLNPRRRELGYEFAHPIVIGKNVWIGGSSIILPGVTIGDDAVVGAGSVVTKNVGCGITVVGNPARSIQGN
ncbi:MAG: sugar O-acetyltransferase [Cyanobacteria bacterium P01_E01_bin.42]